MLLTIVATSAGPYVGDDLGTVTAEVLPDREQLVKKR
jgi:hypothetical protein